MLLYFQTQVSNKVREMKKPTHTLKDVQDYVKLAEKLGITPNPRSLIKALKEAK